MAWYFSTASWRSSLVGNAVRISIRVAPADAELERPRGGGESLRSPPPRQVPHRGERLEHELPWGIDDPGDHDLAVGRRGLRRRPSSPRAHQLLLLPCLLCLLEILHVRVQTG